MIRSFWSRSDLNHMLKLRNRKLNTNEVKYKSEINLNLNAENYLIYCKFGGNGESEQSQAMVTRIFGHGIGHHQKVIFMFYAATFNNHNNEISSSRCSIPSH